MLKDTFYSCPLPVLRQMGLEVLIQWVWKLKWIPFILHLKMPFQFLYFSKRKPELAKVQILQTEQALSAVFAVWLNDKCWWEGIMQTCNNIFRAYVPFSSVSEVLNARYSKVFSIKGNLRFHQHICRLVTNLSPLEAKDSYFYVHKHFQNPIPWKLQFQCFKKNGFTNMKIFWDFSFYFSEEKEKKIK